MNRVLDLNTVERSTLTVTMMDEAKTVLHLKMPTEGLVNELQQIIPNLHKLINGEGQMTTEPIYEMVAKFLSCNRDFIKVTPDDLRGKYQMTLEDVVVLMNNYLDFLGEVANQKN